jgi:pyridoxal phosphate-dependent aminotransferase EpsN
MAGREQQYVQQVFESNWIAPLGPQVDAFEREFAATVGAPYALALSSGTAAIHLALLLAGVGTGDEVLVSTLTFSASVNPVVYVGGRPTFIDSERASWNMDPGLLEEILAARAKAGRLPKAVIPVHLYGQSADMAPILAACNRYGVPVIEDAAEALGATYWGEMPRAGGTVGDRPQHAAEKPVARSETGHSVGTDHSVEGRAPGTLGWAGIFSFNGNKIITTSGGGMLVSADKALIDHARKLSTQAREPAPHYEHTEIGYNYRMSNVLAAIGRGQLEVLEERVQARRRNFDYYVQALGDLPGLAFMPEAPWGRCNRWLTVITVDPAQFGADREAIRLALEAENIALAPSGSRCTCSRCSRVARSWAAPWPRRCSGMGCVCPRGRT